MFRHCLGGINRQRRHYWQFYPYLRPCLALKINQPGTAYGSRLASIPVARSTPAFARIVAAALQKNVRLISKWRDPPSGLC